MPYVVGLIISRINSLGVFIMGFLILYLASSVIFNNVSDQTVGTAFADYGFIVKVEMGIIMSIICVALLFYVQRNQGRGNFKMLRLSGQTKKRVLVKMETIIKNRTKNQIINSI